MMPALCLDDFGRHANSTSIRFRRSNLRKVRPHASCFRKSASKGLTAHGTETNANLVAALDSSAFLPAAPEIGIGGAVTCSPLPHHRTSGSAYGGSAS